MKPAENMRLLCTLVALGLLTACNDPDRASVSSADPLPSWEAGESRQAIVAFVQSVIDSGSSSYVAPADRIAVFDHDGTLIIERPAPVQFVFVFNRIQSLANDHPEWATTEPFKSALENNFDRISAMKSAERTQLVNAAQANMSQGDFDAAAADFFARDRHPRFGTLYTDLVYQPMLELIDYLHHNDFKVFIVSGGGIEFIRSISEEVYGVSKERVIGSSMNSQLKDIDGQLEIWRRTDMRMINVGRYKPLNIRLHTGRRPILAFGNSDGDLQMLEYTDQGPVSLVLNLRHDDPDREYEYTDAASPVFSAASERGWQTVSVAGDFKTVFAEPGQ
jgi:phosphoserine phosphatase